MPYFTRPQIEAEIVAADLVHLLDDDQDGAEDDGLFDLIRQRAEGRIDATLARRYTVPFADAAVPTPVQDAAIVVLCAALYRRRGTPDDENPFAKRETAALDFLRECAGGTADLDTGLDATGAVAAISAEDLSWSVANQEGLC